MYGYRQYWKPQEEVIITKKGLYLRPLEYIAVKELLTEIGRALPELDRIVPCYVQSDHINQLGHYVVWSVTRMTTKTGNYEKGLSIE